MNYKILLVGLFTVCFASCTTAYKAGQTPDDVYYSPTRGTSAEKETKEDRYEDVTYNEDDQYLRMKVRNRNRWSTIDDHDYWNDSRYDFGYYNNNYYNQFGWNNWNTGYYRPRFNNNIGWHPGFFGGGYPIIFGQTVVKPSGVNRPSLKGYNNNAGYNNNNNSTGNTIRKVFSTQSSNNNYNNNNRSEPSRTYNPAPSRTYEPPASSSSSGSSSSSSGSSSSGGGVSRPARGGN